MQQKTLFVAQGHLFHINERGETVDKGACGCALVALPVPNATPKYSLVCYSKKRETLAVARLPPDGHNTVAPRLAVEPSGYVTFVEEAGRRWSLLLAKRDSVVELLAHVALACFVLRGGSTGAPVVTDFSPAVVDRPLGLTHEARVRFTRFPARQHPAGTDGADAGLAEVGPAQESNFDEKKMVYAFQPLPSFLALGAHHRGFEGAVVGMTEGGYRGFVLPAASQYTRADEGNRAAEAGFNPVVFIVRLERIVELAERRTEVPTVFADGSSSSATATVAADQSHGPNSAALVSYEERRHALVPTNGGQASSATATALSLPADGAGIPVEHMAMIQKVGAGVNTATTVARDIRDITAAVADDWQHAVRAVDKPSTLTHAALQDHIRQLVLQHERSASDLEQREELIRSLDERNRGLQKQLDTATLASQKLLDEAKSAASAGMDLRLERSRTLMKLQEQINATTQERDDAQRHLETVKRLRAAAEEELQQLRARIDIHRVQSTGMLSELDVSQTALSEARGRRKGLEARVTSLTESVRSAQAQTRAKASEVEATRAAADRAREHHIQLMEDERNSRAMDAQQLRTQIVAELANKEQSFRAERARAAEEAFRRGLEEGKAQGRRDTAADVAARQNELQLDVQRSKGLAESRREELRAGIEAAMAARRKLVGALTAAQDAHAEAVRKKARLQVRHARLTREAATAKDAVLERLRGVATFITQPATGEQLMSVLTTLHHHTGGATSNNKDGVDAGAKLRKVGEAEEGDPAMRAHARTTDVDLAFNRVNWDAARRAAVERRIGYIMAEALRVFEKGMSFYYTEWLQPLQAAHDECTAAVKALWVEQHGAFHYALCEAERAERSSIVAERDGFFDSLRDMLARQRAARDALLEEARGGFAELFAAYVHGLDRLRDLLAAHRKAREALAAAETEARQRIFAVAMRGLRDMPALLADAVAGERLTAQRFLAEEEEAGRAALLADELSAATVLRFNEEQHRAAARQDTLRARQRQDAREEEARAREAVEAEETAALEQLYTQHIAVVSAIYRQSEELRRLQAAEAQRAEALRAEERRAVAIAEEHHRYEEVEAGEGRARAELAGLEAVARHAMPAVPPPLEEAPAPPPPQPLSPPAPSSAAAAWTASPPAVTAEPARAEESDTPFPPQPLAPAPQQDATGPWDGPPEMPPPTPPDTPTAAAHDGDALSPFALAWAQTDRRQQSPVPSRPAAAKAVPPPPSTAGRRPNAASRGFDDSEAESSGGEGDGGRAGRRGGSGTAQPPAEAPRKKAAPAKKRPLFVSNSDEDE